MEFKIVKRDEIKLIGLKARIDMSDNKISELWQMLFARKGEIKNIVSHNAYGVADNMQFEGDLCFLDETVGLEVTDFSEVPFGMVTKTIKAQSYLVFIHRGPMFGNPDEIQPLEKTYEQIYREAIPKSGYSVEPYFNFELFDERFNYEEADSEFDIYVPIKEN